MYNDRAWERFWAVCAERHMTLTCHSGAGDPSAWTGPEATALLSIESGGWFSRRALHQMIQLIHAPEARRRQRAQHDLGRQQVGGAALVRIAPSAPVAGGDGAIAGAVGGHAVAPASTGTHAPFTYDAESDKSQAAAAAISAGAAMRPLGERPS